jgi:hypothetical protein
VLVLVLVLVRVRVRDGDSFGGRDEARESSFHERRDVFHPLGWEGDSS